MHSPHIQLPQGRWRIFTVDFWQPPLDGGFYGHECGSLLFRQSPPVHNHLAILCNLSDFCEYFRDVSPKYDGAFDAIYPKSLAI
jgi:hypothetical protein